MPLTREEKGSKSMHITYPKKNSQCVLELCLLILHGEKKDIILFASTFVLLLNPHWPYANIRNTLGENYCLVLR